MARHSVHHLVRALEVLTVTSILSARAFASEPPGQRPAPTIRVVARATVSATPDRANVILGVTTDKKSATAAIAENDQKMERVLAALKKEIGNGGEVKTSQLSIHPRFEETRDGLPTEHVLGYTATNTVLVRLQDTRAVPRLLDLAFQAGANTVDDVQFTLKDAAATQNQALRDASAKARVRAGAMAEGQGMRVGDVVALTEGEYEGSLAPIEGGGFFPFKYRRGANVESVPIEVGSIDVTATVTVVFALKPR